MQTENQLQRTAQFFNPVLAPRQGRSFKKQSPILPLMKEIEDFDLLVSKELDKYNKRVLRINANLHNVSIKKPRGQKPDIDTHTISTAPHSLNQSKSMLNLIPINNSPDKIYRPRNIKVIFDPFNQAVTPILRNRQSRNQSVGSCDSAPEIQRTGSQGKSFLQRRPQLKILNRIFSCKSQN